MISVGLEESGYFDALVERHASRFRNERKMAFFFVILSFFLSTFLTNDVALFIMVPLTLAFGRGLGADTGKLIVFEALAVNSGSAISPIGNPQNIYLWGFSGLSSLSFLIAMLPLGILLFSVLMLFTFISFEEREMNPVIPERTGVTKPLLYVSAILLPAFILSLELGYGLMVLALVLLLYSIVPSFRGALRKADWALIALFILMFLDFGILAAMPGMDSLGSSISSSPFLYSALLSQFMSNVPSAIFVSSFSSDWKAIAYGVNVGGNGLVIASMASVIAIRLGKVRLREFHRYSIPFFAITFTALLLLASL